MNRYCCSICCDHPGLVELYKTDPNKALQRVYEISEDGAIECGYADISWQCGEGGCIEFLDAHFPEDRVKLYPNPDEQRRADNRAILRGLAWVFGIVAVVITTAWIFS